MAHFNNGGSKGGGSRFGGRPSGGGGFGKKSWGNDRGNDRGGKSMTMHKAVCAECGKECEVPFRPVDGKPVYCRDCFVKREGRSQDRPERFNMPDRSEYPRKDFHSAPSTRTSFQSESGANDVKKQLEMLNVKIDRLIAAVETIAYKKPANLKEAVEEASAARPKRVVKRKK